MSGSGCPLAWLSWGGPWLWALSRVERRVCLSWSAGACRPACLLRSRWAAPSVLDPWAGVGAGVGARRSRRLQRRRVDHLFLLPQFLCLKNIRTFLRVCHDKFGLRNSELFDPFDLFDVRDFGKVSGPFLPPRRCRLGPAGACWRVCGREGARGVGRGPRDAPPSSQAVWVGARESRGEAGSGVWTRPLAWAPRGFCFLPRISGSSWENGPRFVPSPGVGRGDAGVLCPGRGPSWSHLKQAEVSLALTGFGQGGGDDLNSQGPQQWSPRPLANSLDVPPCSQTVSLGSCLAEALLAPLRWRC